MGRHRGKIKKKDALLLYEAPSGIAIFSLDSGGRVDKMEDLSECIQHLRLEVFIKSYGGSTLINFANNAIDDRLAKSLKMWCRFENKLCVTSAEYKRIIEENLRITCLNVDVPDNEVVSGLKYAHTLLPEEKSEPTKKDHLPKDEVVMFLRQQGIDVKLEMVGKKIIEAAQRLHCIELREKEHLNFLRILLEGFLVKSGIDTTEWSLIHFATAPKFICHPRASYQISHPLKIFSEDEYLKIRQTARQYKRSFSKIDALSVYEDVISLETKKSIILWDLGSFLEDAKKSQEKAVVIRSCGDYSLGDPSKTDLPTTDSYHLEAPNSADPKQQVIPNQTCIAEEHHCLVPDAVQEQTENVDDFRENEQAGNTGDDREKLTASTPGLLEIKQDGHTGAIPEKMNLPENGDTGLQSMDGDTTNLAPEGVAATSEIATASTPGLLEIKQNGHTGTIVENMNLPENIDTRVQGMDGDTMELAPEGIPARSEIAYASTPGDDANDDEKARDDTKILATSVMEIREITTDDKEDNEARDTCVQGMDGDTAKPPPEDIPATSKVAAASTPANDDEKARDDEEVNQARVAGVHGIDGDTMKPAPQGIPATRNEDKLAPEGIIGKSMVAAASTPGDDANNNGKAKGDILANCVTAGVAGVQSTGSGNMINEHKPAPEGITAKSILAAASTPGDDANVDEKEKKEILVTGANEGDEPAPEGITAKSILAADSTPGDDATDDEKEKKEILATGANEGDQTAPEESTANSISAAGSTPGDDANDDEKKKNEILATGANEGDQTAPEGSTAISILAADANDDEKKKIFCLSFKRRKMKGNASSVSSQSCKPSQSSAGQTPNKVVRRSKTMKLFRCLH